ncbi:MAG: hypothetical protein NT086_19660 [Proteobacteria bacterium]|nr:hypothetical protein [Pseudomonadota bacterium]
MSTALRPQTFKKLVLFPIISIAFLMTGCMNTPNELTMKSPSKIFNSKKTAAATTQCIHEQWDNIGGSTASVRQIGPKTRIMAYIGESQLAHIAEVSELEGESIIRYYKGVAVLGPDPWLASINRCL